MAPGGGESAASLARAMSLRFALSLGDQEGGEQLDPDAIHDVLPGSAMNAASIPATNVPPPPYTRRGNKAIYFCFYHQNSAGLL